MHKQETVRANEMHKIHWDFKIQMYHSIPVKISDLNMINN